MADRQLVVYEKDPSTSEKGRLIAIPPGQASGIPLQTVTITTGIPAVGTTQGEVIFDRISRAAKIWDGSAWRDVVPTAILQYADDAALVADTSKLIGDHAISQATGNFYVNTPQGWRNAGVHLYPDMATLLADTTATDGTMGDAVAEGVYMLRRGGAWIPGSIYVATEATILAATWARDGQEAIATDTGNIFVHAAGQWMQDPIQHYPTEALLLAATPPNGTLAWGDDNGLVYARSNGAWVRVNSPTISVSATDPATPAAGDGVFHPTTKAFRIFDGTAWQPVGGAVTIAATAPVSPENGKLWLDTTVAARPVLKIRSGTVWLNLSPRPSTFLVGPVAFHAGNVYTAAELATTADIAIPQVGIVHEAVTVPATGWVGAAAGTVLEPGSLVRKEANSNIRVAHVELQRPRVQILECSAEGEKVVVLSPPATKFVHIRGSVFLNGAAHRLAVIGEVKAAGGGHWINWSGCSDRAHGRLSGDNNALSFWNPKTDQWDKETTAGGPLMNADMQGDVIVDLTWVHGTSEAYMYWTVTGSPNFTNMNRVWTGHVKTVRIPEFHSIGLKSMANDMYMSCTVEWL